MQADGVGSGRPVWPGKYRLTARSLSGATVKSTASLRITMPGPTVQPGLPLKESARSDPATIFGILGANGDMRRANGQRSLPNALERFTRSRRPPMLVRTIMRTV